MKLIVGLGNPDEKYKGSRHNIGFDAVDFLAKNFKTQINKKFKYGVYATGTGPVSFIILKPMTYMNLSGDAVKAITEKNNIKPEDILVIQDELDLPCTKMKIKFGGGAGGHNGIKSVSEKLGTQEFARFRIGIGRPSGSDSVDYVLGKFSKEEKKAVEEKFNIMEKFVLDFLEFGYEKAASRFTKG
ncbi:MAG: aminoacyl-tRNA hydrolase [bacterium]